MATQPDIISVPFANSGAKNTIPTNTVTLGKASLTNGFPTETSMPIADGGVPPQRADFNGMLYWLSTFAVFQQSGGKFTYNSTVAYDPPAIIYYNGDLWWCKQTNSPATVVKTPGSDSNYWIKLRDYLANPLAAYPVGAYYISSESTSPATLFGGTWVQVQDRMILAAGTQYTAGTTANPRTGGGATKSLSVANIPSHTHTFTTATAGNHVHTVGGTTQSAGSHTHSVSGTSASNGNHAHTVSGDTAETGSHTHSVSGSSASAGNHTHTISVAIAEAGNHSHTRGTMNITGTYDFALDYEATQYRNNFCTGAFVAGSNWIDAKHYLTWTHDSGACSWQKMNLDASQTWTGATSLTGSHTHTLTPSLGSAGAHTHSISLTSGSNGNHKHSISLTSSTTGAHTHTYSTTSASAGSHTHVIDMTIGQAGNHTHTGTTNATGNGTAFDVMNPYIVAYVWRRTA